jgi:hypothetical protein
VIGLTIAQLIAFGVIEVPRVAFTPMTIRTLLELFDVGQIGDIGPRRIGDVSTVMANYAAKQAGRFVQKRRAKSRNSPEAFVRVVMEENESAAAVKIKPKNRPVLLEGGGIPINLRRRASCWTRRQRRCERA